MSHSHKDAVGGHVIHGFLGAEEKRFTKRFNRREARREQVAITRAALIETERDSVDWWDEDSFYDDDYYSSDEYNNWLCFESGLLYSDEEYDEPIWDDDYDWWSTLYPNETMNNEEWFDYYDTRFPNYV